MTPEVGQDTGARPAALLTCHLTLPCVLSGDSVDLFAQMGGVVFLYHLSKSGMVHPDVQEMALFTLSSLAESSGDPLIPLTSSPCGRGVRTSCQITRPVFCCQRPADVPCAGGRCLWTSRAGWRETTSP